MEERFIFMAFCNNEELFRKELLGFLKKNSPAILDEIQVENVYMLFRRIGGRWFFAHKSNSCLELLSYKQKHHDQTLVILSPKD